MFRQHTFTISFDLQNHGIATLVEYDQLFSRIIFAIRYYCTLEKLVFLVWSNFAFTHCSESKFLNISSCYMVSQNRWDWRGSLMAALDLAPFQPGWETIILSKFE